ncbi:MAG: Gfo/Idh/MocA family protein [Terriglobales bacterium]
MTPKESKSENSSVGIGVIGCGHWGMNYVRIFQELPNARLVAVCDQRRERLEEVLRRRPSMRVTDNASEVFADPAVDAVVICADASSHYHLVNSALLADKDVLVEKPMATVARDAAALTSIAETNHRVLMVGHTFIYNAGVRKLKEIIANNSGQIYYLNACRTNLGPIRRDVNAVWDLATHDIAIFNYLLGLMPQWASAIGAKVLRNCREDVAFITLGYSGNILGHIQVSWADPNKARELAVVCSDKRIVFNDLNGLEQVRIFEKGIRPVVLEPSTFGEYQLQIRDGDIVSPKIEASEPLKTECRHFLDCVASGSHPLTDGRDGYDVLCVLEAVDRSMKAGGAQMEVLNGRAVHRKAA